MTLDNNRHMKLLLLSNSTNVGERYLEFSKNQVQLFLGTKKLTVIFIPYAAVTFSYDEYESKVNEAWKVIGIEVKSVHHFSNADEAIKNADAIVVGGGNTWKLVKELQQKKLLSLIHERVKTGIPYIGWSAGSNIACPTLRTTNDMPIVEPKNFHTLNLIPFQINPHYIDIHPKDFGGETREQRIMEFITLNQNLYVVGLREGTMLHYDNGKLKLIGKKPARIFKYNQPIKDMDSGEDFNFLLK
ncbi:dipeptidase E [Apibacter mensalis]|uniref:dipeptidase E n=1 Tax=Apibacter mensalis TaxID=1586267 RepID=A0A120N6Q2_9FLAO|nr:dipeptidase PepE [Apibacter mensalis]CVK15249.1 dipeptidase E [Apibacter mensalis]